MSDRQVKVSLIMQASQFVQQSREAAKATRQIGDETARARVELEEQRRTMTAAGAGMLALGTAAAVGVGLAVSRFAEFDAQMSSVQAATNESGAAMGALRAAALEAGASTVFTATEAAGAIEELARAGISTADTLGGGLAGALDLAAAGQLEVGRAAEIAATALTQFKLDGADVPRVADLLAAGAGKAQGEVEDLAQALNQGGLVASQTGLSIEETTGTLAAFASAGLVGSDSGTSFKTMLQRLTPSSKEAREEMQRLGISAYDANGEFVGMSKFAGILQGSLAGLTDEQRNASLGIIFGSDAVRAASVIYDQGAAGVGKWIDAVDESGYAARVAAQRLDNLQGDVEKLGGAFDTALIKTGSAANDTLRDMVQTVTGVVDMYNGLPAPLQETTLGLVGMAGAVSITGGGFLLAVPKIAEFGAGLDVLSKSNMPAVAAAAGGVQRGVSALTAAALGPVGVAFGIAAVAAGTFVAEQIEAAKRAAELRTTLDKTTGAVTDFSRETVAAKLGEKGSFFGIESDSTFDVAEKLGVSLDLVTDAALGNAEAFDELKRRRQAAADAAATSDYATGDRTALLEQAAAWDNLTGKVDGWRTSLGTAQTANAQAAVALSETELAAQQQADAFGAIEGRSFAASEEVEGLSDAIRGFGDTVLNARDTNRNFESSIDDATATLEAQKTAYEEANGSLVGWAASLDTATEAGRDNEAAIDAIVEATKENAAAIYEQTGNAEASTDAIYRGRDALIAQLGQYGYTEDAARAYIDQLGLTPDNLDTWVRANGIPEAQGAIDTFLRDNNGKRISVDVALQGNGVGVLLDPQSAIAKANVQMSFQAKYGRAEGGILPGPPSARDNMFIAAASGEFVVNAAQTERNRDLLEAINSGRGPVGYAGGYATGGYVDARTIQYVPSYAPAPTGPVGAAGHTFNVNNVVNPPASTDPYVIGAVTGRTFADAVTGLLT